jgi:protoheme IX farnesyltransferase
VKSSLSLDQSLLAASPSPSQAQVSLVLRRGALYASLTKPRLVVLVLVTVAVGFLLGARGSAHPTILAATVIGTAMVAGGAGALNQWLERSRDRLMRRTMTRALPSGSLLPAEALAFGVGLAFAGTLLLLIAVNGLAAAIAAITLILYVLAYTPLKPLTTLNTAIGAVPGALPPVIGWAAGTGRLGVEAWALFLIVFLWQFPHFLAIAWIHRSDYERAGFKMITRGDPTGAITGFYAASYALVLLPAGLLPAAVGLAGPIYFGGAFFLGLYYLAEAARFWGDPGELRARRLLKASFLYLPAVLLLLLLDPMPY